MYIRVKCSNAINSLYLTNNTSATGLNVVAFCFGQSSGLNSSAGLKLLYINVPRVLPRHPLAFSSPALLERLAEHLNPLERTMQMQIEPLRWNMYAQQTTQISNDNALSGENVQYNTMPFYELPQIKYRPSKRKAFALYMSPIHFQDRRLDLPGIPLEALLQDLAVITPTIIGGRDRVFRRNSNMAIINLRIMVCPEHLPIPLRLCLPRNSVAWI